MRYSIKDFVESIFSFAVFAAVTLAIASTTYQLLNPSGGLVQWISRTWELKPMLLVVLASFALLVNRWLSGLNSRHTADMMFYVAVLVGLFYVFDFVVAA